MGLFHNFFLDCSKEAIALHWDLNYSTKQVGRIIDLGIQLQLPLTADCETKQFTIFRLFVINAFWQCGEFGTNILYFLRYSNMFFLEGIFLNFYVGKLQIFLVVLYQGFFLDQNNCTFDHCIIKKCTACFTLWENSEHIARRFPLSVKRTVHTKD